MSKNIVYFVLYIIILSEVLIVIVERDEYEEQIKGMVKEMLEGYKQEFSVKLPEKEYTMQSTQQNALAVVISPIGINAKSDSVIYVVRQKNGGVFAKLDKDSLTTGIDSNSVNPIYLKIDENKQAQLIIKPGFFGIGEYNLEVVAYLKRVLPSTIKGDFLKEVNKILNADKIVASNTEAFKVYVKGGFGAQKLFEY
ncbi:MAG: hypothetical protein L6Q59_05425 [Ignavibacteriaceae bacterium]|nr:hypothetical protein [Ignavibacteriaceae bacterium]